MKIVLLLLFFACTLQACSPSNSAANTVPAAEDTVTSLDTTNVPEQVLAKFHSLFPAETKVDWEMEEENYEAVFQDANGEKSVLFTSDGKVIKSESEVNTNSLPEGVNQYMETHLKDKKLEKAEMIVTTEGVINYEIEVDGKDYLFTGDGKFVKIEEEEGNEKD